MRNISIDALDYICRPVVAIGTDYDHGRLLPWHSHRRAQLLFAKVGVMKVETDDGSWIVPPQQAVWIPAGKPHQVLMLGVSTRSLYIEPSEAPRDETHCEVLAVSPLLSQLLVAAVDMAPEYALTGRDAALVSLLFHEIRQAPTLPLHIPLPKDEVLLQCCRHFLEQPTIHSSPEYWAGRLGVSVRTFGRRFRAEVGITFQEWRQRTCVVMALAFLAEGKSITTIALDMGYESPAAFTTMFRRVLGVPPTSYVPSEKTL